MTQGKLQSDVGYYTTKFQDTAHEWTGCSFANTSQTWKYQNRYWHEAYDSRIEWRPLISRCNIRLHIDEAYDLKMVNTFEFVLLGATENLRFERV